MVKPSQIPPAGRELGAEERERLHSEMTSLVEQSHLFKSLDDDGRAEVLESGFVTAFHEGDRLIAQGQVGDRMFVVLSGTVRVHTDSPRGDVPLAELGRGACIGEVSVLTGHPRTATVIATTDVEAVVFAKHRVERVLTRYPKVRQLLEALVERRAHDAIEKIIG